MAKITYNHTEEIGVFDAKTKLSELLDRVAAGAEFIITKHGRPVARLIPETFERTDPDIVKTAFARLRKTATAARFDLSPKEIRNFKNEGRK